MKSGIYKITNLITGKFYIGSTSDIIQRKHTHFHHLKYNKHGCYHLQRSYNKHDKNNFSYSVIEYCEPEKLIEREQFYLDTFLFAQEFIRNEDKRFTEFGYNICPIAGRTTHKKYTEEYINNARERTKRMWSDDKYVKKQSENRTPEFYKKVGETISINAKNKPVNILREKFNEENKNKPTRRELRKMEANNRKDKIENKSKHPKAVRDKISHRNKLKWADEQYKHKQTLILGSPDVVKRREDKRYKTITDPNYINPYWKKVVAIDRKTNNIIYEFRMLKEASEWASTNLGTVARCNWYIQNNYKDFCGFKWMYKDDFDKESDSINN